MLLTVLGIVVLLALAGITGVLMRKTQDKITGNDDEAGTTEVAQLGAPLPGKAEDAQNLRAAGDTEGSSKVINEALNNPATPPDERYNLYIQQGNVASDKNDMNAAIAAYLQAEKVKQTYEIANLLAEMYKQIDNKPKAIEYYKKTLTLVPNKPTKEADIQRIENNIRALEGGA